RSGEDRDPHDGGPGQNPGRPGCARSCRGASGHVLGVPGRGTAPRVPGCGPSRRRHLRRGGHEDDPQGSHAVSRRPGALVPVRRPDHRGCRPGRGGLRRQSRRGAGRVTPLRPDGQPLSLWHDQGPTPKPRPALVGAEEADVVIVGGGYTGLWTAYYLLGARPGLRVVVVESQFCGFGASGRNGGWVSAKFPGSKATMAADHGRQAVVDYQRAMFDAVDEIGRVGAAEGSEADYRKGGMLLFATSPAQEARLQAYADDMRRWGFEEGDLEMLGPSEARERAAVAGAQGARFTPHCASVHPWRLVAGLAEAVERRGGKIFEHGPVRTLGAGLVVAAEV